jgi:hypothetical protein
MVSSAGNPHKSDDDLKLMLEKLEFIKTAKIFRRWRGSFLNRFEIFLEEDNIVNAQGAYEQFSHSMEAFANQVKKVEAYIESGDLTADRYFSSVKARNCLNEMSKMMASVIEEKDALIPSTVSMENDSGYNKFHMGAVLIRDNFEEYGRLTYYGESLQHMRKVTLAEIIDKQILEQMDNYGAKLKKFCDVMADLGLYEVMLKCREFACVEDNKDDLIFLDLKTGGIGELDRAACLGKRVITSTHKDQEGNEIFEESVLDDDGKAKLLKIIRQNPRLGLGFGNSLNSFQEESLATENAEVIRSMWGVTLRKTPRNKKGEEFIFLCQKTGVFGELSRKTCLEVAIITEVKDENGEAKVCESQLEFDERASLLEQIRSLLDLGVLEQ